MTSTILSLSRRHVLGDLYPRCDAIAGDIPVYLANENEPIVIGHVNQSLGLYADAFSFYLDAEECKRLSSGQFAFSLGYELSKTRETGSQSRVELTSITLTAGKPYQKPVAKSA